MPTTKTDAKLATKKSQGPFTSYGVLLVDDQKAARLLLKAFLTRLGLGRIEEATDSITALRILLQTGPGQCPFGAILISRNMREMTGLQLVRAIRQMTGWDTFPVVLISEDADPALVREAATAGATEYMLRPYDEETLKTILERALKT